MPQSPRPLQPSPQSPRQPGVHICLRIPAYPRGRRDLTGFRTATPGARMSTSGPCRPGLCRPGTSRPGTSRPGTSHGTTSPATMIRGQPGRRTRAVRRTRPGAGLSGPPAPKLRSGTPHHPCRPATTMATSARRTSTDRKTRSGRRTSTANPDSTRPMASTRTSTRQGAGSSPASATTVTRITRAGSPTVAPVAAAARTVARTVGQTAAGAGGAAAVPGAGSAGSPRWPRCWSSSSRSPSAASTSTACIWASTTRPTTPERALAPSWSRSPRVTPRPVSRRSWCN